VKGDLLDRLLEALAAKRPTVVATRLPEGDQALLFPLDDDALSGESASDEWPADEARRALLEDRSLTLPTETGSVFLRPYNPPVRLIVVGAVHITAPLARMAATAGIDVHVVDPRTAFASTERFPGLELVHTWPAEALAGLRPDHRTAVVTLTHDAKLDDPALVAALATPAFYVGALGSTRTHAKRVARLREEGVSEEGIARIRAPIGLDIAASTPAEIAVAILAELVAHLRKPAGE
jgi:xanthine dehydrogenase accessory factor